MKIVETIVDFKRMVPKEKHNFFQQVFELDQQIFPHSSIEDLYRYVYDIDALSVSIVQYHHQNKLIGQNIIQILKLILNGNPIFIISSRAGFLAEYRGGNRSLKSAIRVALNHKIRYPMYPLWFVPTIMHPKIYTLFASRSANFFPRVGKKMPQAHADVLQLLHSQYNDVEVRGENLYVHPYDLPKVMPEQLICLRIKTDLHNQFFMQHVPDYFAGIGLICICCLDFKTICETVVNLALDRKVY